MFVSVRREYYEIMEIVQSSIDWSSFNAAYEED